MQRILTFFLGLHWMAHFALLAIASAGGAAGAVPPAYQSLGVALAAGYPPVSSPVLTTGLALGFGTVAVLFLWMLATMLFDENDAGEVGRLAFAAAVGMLTLLLLGGATGHMTGLMPAVSLQIGALLASYVAASVERRVVAASEAEEGVGAAARVMAQGAAHNTMLYRLSGRPGAGESV